MGADINCDFLAYKIFGKHFAHRNNKSIKLIIMHHCILDIDIVCLVSIADHVAGESGKCTYLLHSETEGDTTSSTEDHDFTEHQKALEDS